MSANNPSFEVFTPLQVADFYPQPGDISDIVDRVRERVHEVYREAESTSLPAPESATVRTETARLLGGLSFAKAHYDYTGYGFEMVADSRFVIPFASEEEWGSPGPEQEDTRPEVMFTTSVTVASGERCDPGLLTAILDLRHPGRRSEVDGTLVTTHKRLMGVEGERVRSKWIGLTRGYKYDSRREAAVRTRVGKALARDEGMRIDARTTIETPVALWLLQGRIRALELRSRPTYGRDAQPATPPELIVPTLRVVSALIAPRL